jgi:hypothetical protein
LLEKNGYVVARRAQPGWGENAFELGDEFVAFRLRRAVRWVRLNKPIRAYRTFYRVKTNKICKQLDRFEVDWITPSEFCKAIGIERHTLTRKLKQKNCPKTKQYRGGKGKLITLVPNQELIDFLRQFKTGS